MLKYSRRAVCASLPIVLLSRAASAGGWQPFADSIVAAKCTGGFIVGKDGTVWAQSGATLTTADRIALKDLTETSARAGGLTLGGVRYMYLRTTEDGVMVFKKGASGATVFPLRACTIAATHGPTIQTPACVDAVTKVGVALRGSGY